MSVPFDCLGLVRFFSIAAFRILLDTPAFGTYSTLGGM